MKCILILGGMTKQSKRRICNKRNGRVSYIPLSVYSGPLWSSCTCVHIMGNERTSPPVHYGVSIASLHSGSISRAMVGRSNFNKPGNSNRKVCLSQYGGWNEPKCSTMIRLAYNHRLLLPAKPGIAQFHLVLLTSSGLLQ